MNNLFTFFIFVLFIGTASVNAQDQKYYIDQNGTVNTTTGSIPEGSYYLDSNGHLKSIDGVSGIFTVSNGKVVPVSESRSAPGSAEEKKSDEGSNGNRYYIDENKKLKQMGNSEPEKSYYTNEYGKLLEAKGKKKNNNSTN